MEYWAFLEEVQEEFGYGRLSGSITALS